MDASIPRVHPGGVPQSARPPVPERRREGRDGRNPRREFQLAQPSPDARREKTDARAEEGESPRTPAIGEDGLGMNIDVTA